MVAFTSDLYWLDDDGAYHEGSPVSKEEKLRWERFVAWSALFCKTKLSGKVIDTQ